MVNIGFNLSGSGMAAHTKQVIPYQLQALYRDPPDSAVKFTAT
jgi:hypothetical protein